MTSTPPAQAPTDAAGLTPARARARLRQGMRAPTGGWCNGYQQANLIAVPHEYAYDVLLFAQRNPRPVPVLEVTDAGATEAYQTAPGSDLRTDAAKYCIWQDGVMVEEADDVVRHWRDDLVTFLYGCSLTFERALHHRGVPLRHWDTQTAVPMYDTNVRCTPAGRLHGNLVVSMRPLRPDTIAPAVETTARMPHAHGAPVHVGRPQALGVTDLARPDYGEPVLIWDDEIPVFWACGVTMQAVARAARLPFAITHLPGHMFLTDMPETP